MVQSARRNLNSGEVDSSPERLRPLCVDLDGTLLRTDTLYECLFQLLLESPLMIFMIPYWALRGRVRLKEELATRVELRVEDLPYNQKVISFLRKQQMAGRKVILVTGAHYKIARDVANHLRLFYRVYGTDKTCNLVGKAKRKFLTTKFGLGGYDYLGDSRADLPVWTDCHNAYIVDGLPATERSLKKMKGQKYQVLSKRASSFKSTLKALRVHQWTKNVLIVLPAIAVNHLPTRPSCSKQVSLFLLFR